ncbi:MAG: molybdenum cofactor biosynthesis protein MoaE [Methanotrichaceae archaeon]
MIKITEEEFSIDEVVEKAKRQDAGAIVTFLGIVRNDDILKMEVEAHRDAAMKVLKRIRDESLERFDLKSVDIIHRVGSLSVSESIVLIVCCASHRTAAFRGCEYVLDEIKKRAPISKKEIRSDAKL